jgi:hypothetical protein
VASVVVVLVSILFFEILSCLYFVKFSKYAYTPRYLMKFRGLEGRTEHDEWGAWRVPNSVVRQKTSCFDVEYRANDVGARDRNRKKFDTGKRIVFLGDSFIEGVGVAAEDRISNILEKRLGLECLNFGVGYNTGPLQYSQIYQTLASRYSHGTVVIGLLPVNDFTDNDPDFPRWINDHLRYRPYYRKSATGYDIFYKTSKPQYRLIAEYSGNTITKRMLANFWSYGFYLVLKQEVPYKSILTGNSVAGVGYFETNDDRIAAAKYYLRSIVTMAKGKKIIIMVIPTYDEIVALKNEKSPWLDSFAREFDGGNVKVVDLAQTMTRMSDADIKRLFLSCDPHWSPYGQAVAADILQKNISQW